MMDLAKLRHLFLGLFVFGVCYEYYDPFGIASWCTLSKIAGAVYFCLALLRAGRSFALGGVKRFVLPYLLLFGELTLVSLVYSGVYVVSFGEIFNSSLLFCIVIFWLMLNEMRDDEPLRCRMLLWFIASVWTVALFAALGIGISYPDDRLSFFGSNENSVGAWAVYAMAGCFYLPGRFGRLSTQAAIIGLTLPAGVFLLREAASKGAVFMLLAAFVSFLVLNPQSVLQKFFSYLIGGALLVLIIVNMLPEGSLLLERLGGFDSLESVWENRNSYSTGRVEIWRYMLGIFREYPVFGSGFSGYYYETMQIFGVRKSAHNLFFEILVLGGVTGFALFLVPYLAALWKVLFGSNRSVFVTMLFAALTIEMFKSGGMMTNKLLWFLLAFIISHAISKPAPEPEDMEAAA